MLLGLRGREGTSLIQRRQAKVVGLQAGQRLNSPAFADHLHGHRLHSRTAVLTMVVAVRLPQVPLWVF